MGLGGAVPARAGAEVKQLVLDTVDEAVAAGLAHRWATALWGVIDDRVHRWRARRAERGGSLEDRRPGGAAVQSSTQVRVVFDDALAVEGLIDLLTDERLDLPLDDPRRPILLAVSDNGGPMISTDTRAFMAAVAITQHHGRPRTPTDQAWIESFFGHIKGEWPHLCDIDDPALPETELHRVRSESRYAGDPPRGHRLRHPQRRTPRTRRRHPTSPPTRPATSPPEPARPQPPDHSQQPRQDPMTRLIPNTISAEDSETPQFGGKLRGSRWRVVIRGKGR